jgi:AraC family transcriptional regulator
MAAAVSLDDLAKAAGMSLFHFARSFKQATGETPHRFVTRLRLERAKRLLRESDKDLLQIARSIGFSSSTHLATVFARHVGTTPRAFRQLGR